MIKRISGVCAELPAPQHSPSLPKHPRLRKGDYPRKPAENSLDRLSALPPESRENLLAYIPALEHELVAARD